MIRKKKKKKKKKKMWVANGKSVGHVDQREVRKKARSKANTKTPVD